MKNMVVTIEVPIEFTAKTAMHTTNMHGNYENRYVGVSLRHGSCVVYNLDEYPVGTTVEIIQTNYAIRSTDDGLQYYDSYMWKFFDESVQEAFSNYLAEKELLEK